MSSSPSQTLPSETASLTELPVNSGSVNSGSEWVPEMPADRAPDGETTPAAESAPSFTDEAVPFRYQPVPMLAPVALFFGVVSGMSFITVYGLVAGLLGIVFGLVAYWQIKSSSGAYAGSKIALGGLVLALLCSLGGGSMQAYAYMHEVPEGFDRVSFSQQISRKGFIFAGGAYDFHPDVKALDGQQVFLKGYMYPTGQENGLTQFLLVKDNGQCCFGGQPELEDMIGVMMLEGKTATYHATRVSVAGTFKLGDKRIIPSMINAKARTGNPAPAYYLEDVTHFEISRTSF